MGGVAITNTAGGGGFLSGLDSFLGAASKYGQIALDIGQGISNYKLQKINSGFAIETKRAQIAALKRSSAPTIAGSANTNGNIAITQTNDKNNGLVGVLMSRKVIGSVAGLGLMGLGVFIAKKYIF